MRQNERPSTIDITLTLPEPTAVRVDPERTCLVVVDMQNQSLRPRRGPDPDALRALSVDNRRMVEAIAGNVGILARVRSAGLPVIFIQSVRTADSLEFTRHHRHPHLLEGTWAVEVIDELRPLPDEAVVQKHSHDPFCATALEDVLADRGIDPRDWTVIVTGVSADTCVRAGILGFSHRNYRVVVPLDCTGGLSAEEEAMTWAQLMSVPYRHNIEITTSDLIDLGPVPVGSTATSGTVPPT